VRKLLLQVQTSADGYMADKNGKTDWMLWNWGDDWSWDIELRKYHNEVTASADCILLSRKMAEEADEGFIQHWAVMAEKRENPQSGFAKNIRDAHKVVFTKTLKKTKWDNTVIATGNLVEEVNRLKNATGRNIIAYGGATFVSSLIKAGLVDEFHLIVNPCALGSGLAVFNGLDATLNLSRINSAAYPCGIVVLQYQRTH
jgi:dihydrofolate reductase